MTAPVVSATGSPTGPNAPDYYMPAYREMQQRWAFVRLIRNINESIRTNGEAVLPKFEAEGLKSWNVRLGMTFGFDALDETIHSLVGLATRDDPVLEHDVPERIRGTDTIEGEWEDIDGQGTHGAVFSQHAIESAVQDGHAALLVDMPPTPPGLTVAQEAAFGVRAYLVLVPIDRITAWRVGRILGRKVLTMVKIEESREVDDGVFGAKDVRRFRTLRQQVSVTGEPFVTYEVHEAQSDRTDEYHLIAQGTLKGPQWIPFHPFYGGERAGILRSLPPLRGLAYSNLDHTQVKSDRRYSMHKCAVPFPIWRGRTKAPGEAKGAAIVISSDTGMDVSEGGGGEYMEPKGTALEALRLELTDIERRMGSQGFSMLRREAAAQTTLGEKRMQSAREESKLSRAVRSYADALEAALGSMAAFYGLDDGGSVTMSREFTDDFLSVDELRLLNTMEDEGKLTLETFLQQVQKCTRLLEGVDLEAEIQRVTEQRAQEPLTVVAGGSELIPGLTPAAPAVPGAPVPPTPPIPAPEPPEPAGAV